MVAYRIKPREDDDLDNLSRSRYTHQGYGSTIAADSVIGVVVRCNLQGNKLYNKAEAFNRLALYYYIQ